MENSLMTGDMKHLRLPITTNVKPGMKVLIVPDTAHDPRVGRCSMSTISEVGAEATLADVRSAPGDYYDPPQAGL